MEREYWLARKRYHAASAQAAATSDVRLIHLDLAGRYSVKAAVAAAASARAASAAVSQVGAADVADATYYERLEVGARWLASKASEEASRHDHLRMANRYARLRREF